MTSQKPKSHRRGIADGFGGLHKVCVSSKRQGRENSRLRRKRLHEPDHWVQYL